MSVLATGGGMAPLCGACVEMFAAGVELEVGSGVGAAKLDGNDRVVELDTAGNAAVDLAGECGGGAD